MNQRYLQKEQEGSYEYGLRLIKIKMEEKPSDLDWIDIVELLNLDVHRDSLRKSAGSGIYSGYAVMKYYEGILDKLSASALPSQEYQRLQEQELEIKQLTVQMRDERNLLNKQIRDFARNKKMTDIFKEIISNRVECKITPHIPTHVESDNELVVMLSDVHYGMCTKSAFNEYDTDIAIKRLESYLSDIYEICKLHQVKRCHLALLGDLISGSIKSLIRIENMENVVNQISQISEILTEFTKQLSTMVEEVHVYNAPGNHSRIVAKKEDNEKGDYLDLLIPHYMNAALSGLYNVHIHENELDESICIFNVHDFTFVGVHGDKDSPATAVDNISKLLGYTPDGILLGHKHQNAMFPSGEVKIIQNGSLSGMDNYTIDKRLTGIPEQIAFIVTPENKVKCLYNIQF